MSLAITGEENVTLAMVVFAPSRRSGSRDALVDGDGALEERDRAVCRQCPPNAAEQATPAEFVEDHGRAREQVTSRNDTDH
jgi:hypothetical protein